MPLLPPAGIGDFVVRETTITLAVAAKVVAQNSPNRISLIFAATTGTCFISTQTNPSATIGIQFSPTVPPIQFDWQTDGALVNQAWYGSGSGGILTVFEIFYQPFPKQNVGVRHGDTQQTDVPYTGTHRKS